jgi:hypothetical protein
MSQAEELQSAKAKRQLQFFPPFLPCASTLPRETYRTYMCTRGEPNIKDLSTSVLPLANPTFYDANHEAPIPRTPNRRHRHHTLVQSSKCGALRLFPTATAARTSQRSNFRGIDAPPTVARAFRSLFETSVLLQSR